MRKLDEILGEVEKEIEARERAQPSNIYPIKEKRTTSDHPIASTLLSGAANQSCRYGSQQHSPDVHMHCGERW